VSGLSSGERAFAGGQGPLRIGTRRLAPADWLELDEGLEPEIAVKERLWTERPSDVYQSVPGSERACDEALDLVVAQLIERHSRFYRRKADDLVRMPGGRECRIADSTVPSLVRAGLLVQEDLCVLAPARDGYVLAAAFVCAPSHWRLADKIGKALTAVHEPVPGYQEVLAASVDRLFDRLEPGALIWRSNWAIGTSRRLFEPERDPTELARAAQLSAADVGRALYLRVESQTLRRLERSRAVLFTIRVFVDPLEELAARPAAARDLAAAIRGLTQAQRRYKSLDRIERPLLGYLDMILAAAPTSR
jgi:hypothetical protein